MKRIILMIMLITLSPVVASKQNVSLADGLTDQQVAEIKLQAIKLAQENKTIVIPKAPMVSPNQVKEWAEVIDAMGDGIVSIANKSGIAVNEFATSPVGMFTMFVIGWQYMGSDFVGFIVGTAWLMFMIPIWLYCYRRRFILSEITTYNKKDNPDGIKKHVKFKETKANSVAEGWAYIVSLLFICSSGFIIIF